MNLQELLKRHPARWVCHDRSIGCVVDANGGAVFIGENALSSSSNCKGWEFASIVIDLINAAAEHNA